ncbi:C39 family peptidase [Cohnella lubricantis]|uniref:C39 family peptidase n=1 Tax=Cohnella lubricantis TaxID=2163172 RepID=A0A841T961_9BACL|nr:C39 family peptidase [Cohnella lubricantis]MBB6675968.1 C39 family peptidase [Cohnella lubricantis]MBP2117913.1 hypothetical protein [Cohnella lubricantis]
MNLVYYNQEDPRWRNVPYTIRGDKSQTIGTSACGPTSFAMAASSLLGRSILPTETAAYAVDHGYRTDNNGTAWGFFSDAAEYYSLTCRTGNFAAAKQALAGGALVVASMRSGHFTSGGHYILLVGAGDGWIDVYDPNKDNRKYGADGLVDQGVKDDGKVRAKDSVIQREAGQFWIITKPVTAEEADEVLQLSNYQWGVLESNVKQMLDNKTITDETWLTKIKERTLTASELAWLTFVVVRR